MLPKNAMVAARKAIERLYDGKMEVIEHQKVLQPNHTTGFKDVTVLKNQPCRISFSSSPSTGNGDVAALTQSVRLFYAPEIRIKEGSKIVVTQHGTTIEYCQSGLQTVYETHSETNLEVFKGWA